MWDQGPLSCLVQGLSGQNDQVHRAINPLIFVVVVVRQGICKECKRARMATKKKKERERGGCDCLTPRSRAPKSAP